MVRSSGIRGRLAVRAAAAFAAAVLVAGCEGGNLFEGEVAEEGPRIELTVPTSVEEGETFTVTVRATAPRGVQFIDVTVVGDPTGGQRFDDYDGISQVEIETVSLTASSTSSTMTIEAFVQDVNGRNSATERATIQVTAPTTGGAPSD
ncbi:MAG TPA: hypothetical protein VHG09_01480 [Longimicrobiales bacterium]|nr:hypothetical protein [Longimicrobiales bacterium]